MWLRAVNQKKIPLVGRVDCMWKAYHIGLIDKLVGNIMRSSPPDHNCQRNWDKFDLITRRTACIPRVAQLPQAFSTRLTHCGLLTTQPLGSTSQIPSTPARTQTLRLPISLPPTLSFVNAGTGSSRLNHQNNSSASDGKRSLQNKRRRVYLIAWAKQWQSSQH